MIFVSVGTQLSFDRLIKTVDAWLEKHPNEQAFFQIAEGEYQPQHGEMQRYVGADKYQEIFESSDLIISHAGMGTIIAGLEAGKSVIVMPRRFALGEHRNDHQMATASRIGELGGAEVAWNEDELISKLDAYADGGKLASGAMGTNDNLIALCSYLDTFLDEPNRADVWSRKSEGTEKE